MNLKSNEFTIQGLIKHLNDRFGSKITGNPFNDYDIAQYCIKGNIPYRYGGNKIVIRKIQGIKIIKLEDSIVKERELV